MTDPGGDAENEQEVSSRSEQKERRSEQKARIGARNRRLANAAREVGADWDLVYFACLIGDPDAIIELSVHLLEKLEQHGNIRREAIKRKKDDPDQTSVSPVREGGAVPCSTVTALAYFMLERCVHAGILPPSELVQLLYSSLNIEKWRGKKEVQKERERFVVAKYLVENTEAGPREVARATGVSSSTVSDWMNDTNFKPVNELASGVMRFRLVSKDRLDIVGPQGRRSAPARAEMRRHCSNG